MKIDLGQKYDSSPCCAPSETGKEKKVSYPSLYFTHDEPVELPDEGTAVITFRKVESSENTRDPEDPKYRCEIEVHSIDVKPAKEKGMVSMADAFKNGLNKKMMERMGKDEE